VKNRNIYTSNSDISLFISKIYQIFLLPSAIVLILLLLWDPFKVFFNYKDYYDSRVSGNREFICYKLFNRLEDKSNISNFIIGSSRSQSFKTRQWKKYIKKGEMFHWDGSGLGLYRSANAIDYLSKSTNKIDNILLIVDPLFFREIEDKKNHIAIQPPQVSNESSLDFYFQFFRAEVNFRFLFSYSYYKLNGEIYHDFMGNYLAKSHYYDKSDNLTADIWYAVDKDIDTDSIGYYSRFIKNGVFYSRPDIEKISEVVIGKEQIILLAKIREIVEKENINIKFIISPTYDQVRFNDKDLKILECYFGKKNIYDFSGKNEITDSIANYYESNHFKPNVANKILNVIYSKSSKENNLQQSSN
jgi:hypothetical protein